MAYCFTASVLPVWTLLQPRDFINSHQLVLALALLVGGLFVAGLSGEADLVASAPAYSLSPTNGISSTFSISVYYDSVWCHQWFSLSGQQRNQPVNSSGAKTDAQYVGYGAMLLEGALAVIVHSFLLCRDRYGRHGRRGHAYTAGGMAHEIQSHRTLEQFRTVRQSRSICRRRC